MLRRLLMLLSMAGLLLAPHLTAYATTLTFDSLTDREAVTSQFPGLTFTNTIALTTGLSLDEFENPPYSGDTGISDDGGPLSITFAMPQGAVSGYFTYATPLIFTAFDLSNTAVATAMSAFSPSNQGISGVPGSAPNELLSVVSPTGIIHVTIAGDPFGSSFTLDNLTFTPIPEPATGFLVGIGLVGLLGMRACWRHFHRG